jgi:hypothetical protein
VKTFWRALTGLVLGLVLCAAALVLVFVSALAPKEGEWRTTLQLGPLEREASVPTLIRWAAHPLVRPLLDGRSAATRTGRWQITRRADGSLDGECAPCRVQLDGTGAEPVAVDRLRVVVNVRGADRFDGSLWLGAGSAPVVLPWTAELKPDGLHVKAELAPTPLASLLAPMAAQLPELSRARLAGRVALKLDAIVGAHGVALTRIVPRLEDIGVDGLGTQALLDVDAAQRCRPQPAGGRIEGWIQNAVIAAEDARFFEHPGYELETWVQVWKGNQQQPQALQGASTITQQLAKLLYTGDERSPARKVREWLYAVEMERTLGKGRILQLYLAVLPWGDGVCGAEAAARHHLGKPANQLKPREAAWLAGLLVNPDRTLRDWARDDAVARDRAIAIVKGIRRLPRERREAEMAALENWRPPIGRMAAAP